MIEASDKAFEDHRPVVVEREKFYKNHDEGLTPAQLAHSFVATNCCNIVHQQCCIIPHAAILF